MNKDINNLINLGFSENDAKVYLALTELKTSLVKPIIAKTGLHRSLVYTSLEHLVSRKLVSEFESKGKKHFSIVSPEALVHEFDEKHKIAEIVSANIKEKISSVSHEITIHTGNEEYLSLLATLINKLPKGGTKYVLGTGGEEFMRETMLPIWSKYHRVVENGKIKIKMIGYESQRQAIEPYTREIGLYEIKYLPSEMQNPAGVHIYPEAGVVLNIIYSTKNNPVTVIKMKNKELVDGYLNLFNHLWRQE